MLEFKNILQKNKFPIGVYCGPQVDNGKSTVNERYMRLLKDCDIGFVVRGEDYTTEEGKRLVALYNEYGIGYFVEDSRVKNLDLSEPDCAEKMRAYIKEYENEPCYLGPYFADEPNMQELKRYAKLYEIFQSINGLNAYPYINLLPSNGDGMLDANDSACTFEKYIQAYIEGCGFPFLSYDHYMLGTGLNMRGMVLENEYLNDLNTASATAKKYKIPFWGFIACGGQWQSPVLAKEYYPNERQFMLSVHLTLAFGAKGLQYFPFLQPSFFYGAAKSYKVNGMIGYNGVPNKWYYYAQKVNAFIRKYEAFFCNAEHKGVFLCGGSALPTTKGGVVLEGKKYGIVSFVEGSHAVVGVFERNGKEAYYIVNNSYEQNGEVNIRFDDAYDFSLISMDEEREILPSERMENGKCVMLSLKPAQAYILWKK